MTDFEITIDALFAHVGKLFIELEEAKKLIIIKDQQIQFLQTELEAAKRKESENESS